MARQVNRSYFIHLHKLPSNEDAAWETLTITMLKMKTGTPIRQNDANPSCCVRKIYTAENHRCNDGILSLASLTNRPLLTAKLGGQKILKLDLLTYPSERRIRAVATTAKPRRPAPVSVQPSKNPGSRCSETNGTTVHHVKTVPI